MPVANQYVLSHRELTELIIKASDVHEGKWMLLVNFAFSAGNFGPSEPEVIPGVIAGIQQIGIQRAEDTSTGKVLIVDAAEVNPA